MTITLNGTTGIDTPAITNNGAYTGDGVVFADATPSNTLVTNTSGNVGIGTSSPLVARKLTVQGRVAVSNASGANDSQLAFYADGTTNGIYSTYNSTGSYLPMAFYTADVERMRIDSSGNLLVGTSSVAGAGGLTIYPNYTNTTAALLFNKSATGGTTCAEFRYNGAVKGSIQYNDTTTTYATSSDYRLKENIASMTGALATISALKPVTYTWKADGSDGQGFIAHELQEVVPDCVTGKKDAVDEEGNPVYQGIDTSFLVATLTSAIQELKAIVDAQAERIAVLENK